MTAEASSPEPGARGGAAEARALKAVVLAAILLRLLCAVPGLLDASLLMRPDSAGYIQPAKALLQDFAFETAPGSGVPELMRTPGYPFYLACLYAVGGDVFCALASSLLAGLACVPVHFIGRRLLGWQAGIVGAALFALNPTAIAMGPLFLSDSLFALAVAFQLLQLLKFFQEGGLASAALCGAFAGFGALVRPLNAYWLAPGALATLFALKLPLKKRLAGCGLMLGAALCFITPWIARNGAVANWPCLSSMTGEQLLFFNGAILEASVKGESPDDARRRFAEEAAKAFAANPESFGTERLKAAWKERRFAELLKEHPVRYALLHLRPYMLIPDIASLSQNLGITQGEKGTFAVLSKEGPLAAAKLYFGGRYWPVALFAPLLLAVALCYALAALRFASWLRKPELPLLALFVAFPVFYMLIPGPVAMPRYQLPALPLLCAMAGAGAVGLWSWLRERRAKRD